MSAVKRTEQGWAGHFICSGSCLFRRNTLIEYEDRKWIISTVGAMVDKDGKPATIGYNRWYETMVFEAELQGGYWEADVSKQIYFEGEWGIWASSFTELMAKYPTPDNTANNIHEAIVEQMTERIQKEEVDNG